MKKKILTLSLALFMFVPAMFLLTACCGDKDPKKLERENTVEVISVFQDCTGSVYLEIEGFEHKDYELIGMQYDSTSLEFSVNNGNWFEMKAGTDLLKKGKGIYPIMSPGFNETQTEITEYFVGSVAQTVDAGEEIIILIRIPESNTHKASSAISTKYTLKQYTQSALNEQFESNVNSLGGSSSVKDYDGKFVFYQDNVNRYKISVGKYYTPEGSDDVRVRELTEEEKQEVSSLNLEYRVVNYDEKYVQNRDGVENIDDSLIVNEENDAVYSTVGWKNFDDSIIPNESNLWGYAGENWNYKALVVLVRQKATDDTLQSEAMFLYDIVVEMTPITNEQE